MSCHQKHRARAIQHHGAVHLARQPDPGDAGHGGRTGPGRQLVQRTTRGLPPVRRILLRPQRMRARHLQGGTALRNHPVVVTEQQHLDLRGAEVDPDEVHAGTV